MKTAKNKKRFQEIEKHLEPYFKETGYDLNVVQLRWVSLAMESYAKQEAITFAEWLDSKECIIALQNDLSMTHKSIEEKAYSKWKASFETKSKIS